MADSFIIGDQSLSFNNISAYVDNEDGSIRFINNYLSSINFDGAIPTQFASVTVASVNQGQYIGIYDNDGNMNLYPIVRVDREDPVFSGSAYTGITYISYIDNNNFTISGSYAETDKVLIQKETWNEKIIGSNGWIITQEGNAIFSNVAIRGELEATTLDVGGANGITYDGASVIIGADVYINASLTVNSLTVGASPTLLRISDNVSGSSDGIYIDSYNYWFSDGTFGVGGSAGSAKWNGSNLSITGNINATSGSFKGDITAQSGRFTGSVTVDSGGKFIAGTINNGVVLDDSGLTGYNNGLTMFKIPTTGSPTLAGFTVINTGITGSGTNANIVAGTLSNGIIIRGDKLTSSAAIYTVLSGSPTTATTGSGFYVDELGRFRLAGSNGSLIFDGDNLSITGSVTATAGTFTGSVTAQTITANNGSIAGFTLSNNQISTASVIVSSSGGLRLGNPVVFSVDQFGNLVSTSASITGNITANSGAFTGSVTAQLIVANTGSIAGFVLSNSSLTASTSTANTSVGMSTGASAFFAGGLNTSGSAGAAFWISRTGSVFAQAASISGNIIATSGSFSGTILAQNIVASVGNIGGFTLSASSLTASTSTANTSVGITTTGSAFFAGGFNTTASAGANFWVSRTGSVFARAGYIGTVADGFSITDSAITTTDSISASSGITYTANTTITPQKTLGSQNNFESQISWSSGTKVAQSGMGFRQESGLLYPRLQSQYYDGTAYQSIGIWGTTPTSLGGPYIVNLPSITIDGPNGAVAGLIGAYATKRFGFETLSGVSWINIDDTSGNRSIDLTSNNNYLTINGYNNSVVIGTNSGVERLRINSNGDFNFNNFAVYFDKTNARVGINTSTPNYDLDVNGLARFVGRTRVGAADFSVDTDVLYVDATNNRVGINDSVPAQALDVTGNINVTGNIQMDDVVIVGTDGGGQFQAATWIGNSSTDQTARVSGNYIGAGGRSIFRRDTSTAGAGGDVVSIHKFNGTSGTLPGTQRIMQILISGINMGHLNVDTSASTAPVWAAPSDYRLKENIEDFNFSSELIKKVKIRSFNWKGNSEKQVGFIAHELQEVARDIVEGEKDQVDFEGNPVYQSIMDTKLIPYLAGALKDALLDIEKLYARIDQLEEKISRMENNG